MTPATRCAAALMAAAMLAGAGSCGAADTQPERGTMQSVTRTSAGTRDAEFLRTYAATRGFTHGTPKNIAITPDGSSVLFLRSGPRSFVQDLYELDVAIGQERVLLTAEGLLGGGAETLTAEELARRERMRLASRGIAGYALSQDGKRVLVTLSGRTFVLQRTDGAQAELTSKAGYAIDARFSPDGNRMSCVRDGDLYVTNVLNGQEERLTSRKSATVTNGLAEFVAQEEMDRFVGYWWSPDSSMIVYESADTAGMETFHIADPMSPGAPAQEWPYPRPGRKNAAVRLYATDAHGRTHTEIVWDHEKYEYLAKEVWPERGVLTLLVMNRAQTELAVLEANPATGATREMFVEKDAAWVNLMPSNPTWLKDGSGFLWMSESSGEWRLSLRGRDGAMQRGLIGGAGAGFGLEGVAGVDGAAGEAYVLASADTTQTQVWRVKMDGSAAAVQVSAGAGRHGVVVAKDAPVRVETRAMLDGEMSWRVVGKGKDVAIKSVRETPPWTPRLDMEVTEGAREMRALVIRPRDMEKGKKYPVLVNVYGGPHHRMVSATAAGYYLQQWMADQGFIVVSMDGRGTPGRGRDWERAIKNELIDPALEDQAAGVLALGAKHPEMDTTRIGIYGWSFGGYFSAMATMRRPDVFKAGCAGAPVCDWLDYDTCYTERYLGVPGVDTDSAAAGNAAAAEVYRKSSVLTYCDKLERPLLIVHGTADDNVYFMHSLKMTQALFRAGKEFEFLPLAGFTHMVPDPVVTERLYSRIAGFFQRTLGRSSHVLP